MWVEGGLTDARAGETLEGRVVQRSAKSEPGEILIRHVAKGACWVAVLLAAIACGQRTPTRTAVDRPGFIDFTLDKIESLAEFQQLAAVPADEKDRPSIAGAKFVITDFSDPARRKVHFLDGRQYQFHDEWFWFRQLNGQRVPGEQTVEPHPFSSPELARVWARAHADDLPSELEMVTEERLYAAEFYRLSLDESQRAIGAGSLIHVPARPPNRPEIWAFELDYTDPVAGPELGVFFEALAPVVPAAARAGLRWIARSPEQMQLASELAENAPQLRSRFMTYEDVSVPGETEVYSSGIVAASNGTFPVTSSYRIVPSAHTSARASTWRVDRICSGAM